MTLVALPSGTSDADRFARSLATLRGPEITAVDGSLVAEDLRVFGQMLADARARTLAAVDQAHPGRATELLSELEAEYGLANGAELPTADRQRRLLAKYRSRNAGTRTSLLITARTLAAEALIATVPWSSVELTDPLAVHRFVLLITDAHWSDDALVATLDALFAAQSPAHVGWNTAEGAGPDLVPFVCDSPDSLCDRNVLAE